MKIGLITDTHYGCRNDNSIFYDYFKKSNDYFFKTLEDNGIDTIIHLGDFFDRRKYVNFVTASFAINDLGLPLKGYDTHLIVGNHDCYYNNTNSPNSPEILLRDWMKIWTGPVEIEVYGTPILLLPWINDQNRLESLSKITDTKAKICLGHLEIAGFVMDAGRIAEHGLSASIFDKFDFVASGHFHTKSDKGNIHYLGAHGEYSWADYNDPRGFHIFDLETKELQFYKNPYTMFHMIVFDNMSFETISNTDFSKFYEKFVKVVVMNKNDQYLFDLFLEKLYGVGPSDISIIESNLVNLEAINDGTEISSTEDTSVILDSYVDSLQTTLELNKIKHTMQAIYNEARAMENNNG